MTAATPRKRRDRTNNKNAWPRLSISPEHWAVLRRLAEEESRRTQEFTTWQSAGRRIVAEALAEAPAR